MKIIKVLSILALIVFSPAIFLPKLLEVWQLIVFCVYLTVLIATHPKMSFLSLGANDAGKNDKYSTFIINIAVYLSFAPIYLSILFMIKFAGWNYSTSICFTGLFIATLGLIVRIISIRQLGRWFTSAIVIQSDHKLFTDGIYGFIRHPSYTGAALFWIAQPLFFSKPIFLFWSMPIILFAYLYRINKEEKMLRDHFGKVYEDYCKSTKRLIPFVY